MLEFLWPTFTFYSVVQPAAFLKSSAVPEQSFRADSVNDVQTCSPFRSSTINKRWANKRVLEARCSLCHWRGSELHFVLCRHLSETLRLFFCFTNCWRCLKTEWFPIAVSFFLWLLFFMLPHPLLSPRYFEHSQIFIGLDCLFSLLLQILAWCQCTSCDLLSPRCCLTSKTAQRVCLGPFLL